MLKSARPSGDLGTSSTTSHLPPYYTRDANLFCRRQRGGQLEAQELGPLFHSSYAASFSLARVNEARYI